MTEARAEFPALAGGSVVTLGAFDGVHRGHQEILKCLAARSRETAKPPVVVTFRPHPLDVVKPSAAPPLLTPGAEQLAALAEVGVERAVLLSFTPAVAALDARAFVEQVLVGLCRMRELVVGYNHKLGRDRTGDVPALVRMGDAMGFAVHVVQPTLDAGGVAISSTVARAAVQAGDMERAAELLGRPYSLRGTVVQGHQRGRTIGYPTMNVVPDDPRKLLPADGVYAVRADTNRGTFGGMMNLGGRPTFGELERALEVHLFDFEGVEYGARVSVTVLHRLRDVMRFTGPDALVAQLATDAKAARLALTQA
jgi:riboflavin kinase/FMN adenylyltransferase